MTVKTLLYFGVAFLVIWAMDSVNINQIFKKIALFKHVFFTYY